MKHETEEMRQARHDLQDLSASDPAASTNILRHAAALTMMVSGRHPRERRSGEPQVGAGFILTPGDDYIYGEIARGSKTDYLLLTFDIDDAAGPLVAITLFREEGTNVFSYPKCRLWSPANDGRALVVPADGEGQFGYFSFRKDAPMALIHAPLPGDFAAGARRADARMRRILTSAALRDVPSQGYMHTLLSEQGSVSGQSRRVAA